MDGILNVSKPPDITSFGVVAAVKRLSGEKHVGHAGTLDPAATGVLPVCLGKATRIVNFLMDSSKVYRAQIELGISTDTYDMSGNITHVSDPYGIGLGQIEAALVPFRGTIQQVPPMYSAIKHEGKPLYRLARAGIVVERTSRKANIYHLEVISWEPPILALEVECSKGTYIRSLANDLGQALGCGAALKNLTRTKYGPFYLKNALSIPTLEDSFRHGYWEHFVYPADSVLLSWDAMILNESNVGIASKGGFLKLTSEADAKTQKYCRAYSFDGRFLAVLRSAGGQWHGHKLFI